MRSAPYRCTAIDPPWPERGGGVIKRGADRHYPLLSVPDIIATVLRSPAWNPAPDAHLWLWATNNYLGDAFVVIAALGFRYVTAATWVKAVPTIDGLGCEVLRPQAPGLGQYLRGQTEQLLFAVRGRLPAVLKGGTLIAGPRGRHSAKPAAAFALIERVSPGPRLEMFAREIRPGWDAWGNDPAVAPPAPEPALLPGAPPGFDPDPKGVMGEGGRWCSGITATWCPNCGDCSCPPNEAGERTLSDPGCPLHSDESPHGSPP